jgi:hypothetical protein
VGSWYPKTTPETRPPLTAEELQGKKLEPVPVLAAPPAAKEKLMEETYRPATVKDLIEALTQAGLVTRYSSGISSAAAADARIPTLKLNRISAAMIEDPTSDTLGYVQIPGIFVKTEQS